MSTDSTSIEQLRSRFHAQLASASTAADLKSLHDEFLSRKAGAVTGLMKTLGTLPPDARREFGQLVNTLKTEIETALDERRSVLESTRRPAGAIDVTLPGRKLPMGRIHPLMRVRREVEDIFAHMGYEILEGPETEDDYHNFEALNMPPDHPARDMQDTLYLRGPFARAVRFVGAEGTAHRTRETAAQERPATLLRTHTSAMQIRYMQSHRPPVRVIAPGRVYRRDNLDLTHTPMFQQVEGLVVGERVTMGDLKGSIIGCLREMFGPDTPVMFRPSFFPYTEPSADVFIGCRSCGGAGCAICKRTGWIEVLGCGMVHPAVFEAVGYDSAA